MAESRIPAKRTISEYGREYGAWRHGQYLLPCDEKERDRLDMMHTMIKVSRPVGTKRLTQIPTEHFNISAPDAEPAALAERPRILDLGCGTGVWMNDMAEQFPHVEIVGVDMHNMAAEFLPPNISLRTPWDYESPWSLGEASWDLIRLQMGLGSVSDWRGLFHKVRRHLMPGRGWFESVEIDFEPRCESGSLKPGKLHDWWNVYLKGSFEAINRRLHYDPTTYEMLADLGFTDIQHVSYRIPLSEWTDSKRENRAAAWWQLAMSPDHDGSGGCGLEAMTLAPLCKFSGWPPEHVKRLCNEALAQITDPKIHAYNVLHIWWAKAPPAAVEN